VSGKYNLSSKIDLSHSILNVELQLRKALEDSNGSFQLPPLIWGWELSKTRGRPPGAWIPKSGAWKVFNFNCWRFASKWWRVPSTPSIDKMIFPCRRCFPIQRKINLECSTLAGMYLLPLLHWKFVVLYFSTLSFVNSDTTIFNGRSLFLRMFFDIQSITQKEKPSFQQTQTSHNFTK
jgi:hypothetical protein